MKIHETKIRNRQNRLLKLDFGSKILTTPTYFPAVSSVEKNKNFSDLVKLIIKSSYPQMLISAYDFHYYFKPRKLNSSINKYAKKHFLFVDSGGYESYWNSSKKWNFDLYKKATQKIKSDFHTSFDDESDSDKKLEKIYDKIIDGGSLFPSSQYIPIFHAGNSAKLIKIISTFLSEYPYAISFLAVREKELGATTLERAKTIFQIRKIINKVGGTQILHVLGVGHPISMALYSYCGADSFDSADWFTHTLDLNTCQLREVSQLDLVRGISPSIEKIKNPYARVLIHNLDSYNALMKKIQGLIKNNKLRQFLIKQKITDQMLSTITK